MTRKMAKKDLHIACNMLGEIFITKVLENGELADDRINATKEAIKAVTGHLFQSPPFYKKGRAGYSVMVGSTTVCLAVYDPSEYKLVKRDGADEQ